MEQHPLYHPRYQMYKRFKQDQAYPLHHRRHQRRSIPMKKAEQNLKLDPSLASQLAGMHVCQKPAIYLYPTKTTDLTVGVMLNKDQFTATVPEFTQGTMWNVTAKPNGDIIYKNKVVPYLFWEAYTDMKMQFKEGFFVKKGQGRQFLEKVLTAFNLNDREKFDFITYWLPTLNRLGDSFVSFQLGNYCHSVPLITSVEPDTIICVFMAIKKAEPEDKLKPTQTIPHLERKGFTLIEWGGSVVRSNEINLLK